MRSTTNSRPCACCGRLIANKAGKRRHCSRRCGSVLLTLKGRDYFMRMRAKRRQQQAVGEA